MSIINRYLQWEILQPFFYVLAVVVFVLLLGQLFKIANLVISEGVHLWDVTRMVLAMIPQMLTMALPIAFFFAVLSGLGRLVGDGEVTALQAAGVSPYRLFLPVLQLAVICTLLTLLMSAWLAPLGMRQLRRATFDILKEKVTLALHAQTLSLAFPGMAIYLGEMDRQSGRVKSVFIADRRRRDHPQTITATAGRIVSEVQSSTLMLQLENGTIHEYNPSDDSYQVTDFSQYRINFALSTLLGEKLHVGFINKARSNADLVRKIALEKSRGQDVARSVATLYERFTQPFACLAFALLGVALVLVPVRSGARFRGFVNGFLLLLAYYLTGIVARSLAEWQPPWVLFFFSLPNLIFILAGLFLLSLKHYEIELSLCFWRSFGALGKVLLSQRSRG